MNSLRIRDIKFKGVGIIIEKTLIVSDIHIGYEEALNKQGVMIPRIAYKEIERITKEIMNNEDIEQVIINGDLKHEFGTISKQEWREVNQYLDLFKDKKIILIKGNHDTILKPIIDRKGLELRDYYILRDYLIVHGHKKLSEYNIRENYKRVIMGHEHIAIGLRSDKRKELYKSFLYCKELIAMPSLFPLIPGTDILREKLLSPILNNRNIDKCKAIIIDENYDLYNFGELKKIRLSLS